MLLLPHISQPRPPRLPLCPLHHLHALHQRRVHLIPHLDADAGQLAAEQDGGVDASPPDVDADAGEGLAGALADEEDVADAGALRVRAVEEAGAGAGGVVKGELGCGEGGDGVGAGFFDGAWSLGLLGEFTWWGVRFGVGRLGYEGLWGRVICVRDLWNGGWAMACWLAGWRMGRDMVVERTAAARPHLVPEPRHFLLLLFYLHLPIALQDGCGLLDPPP